MANLQHCLTLLATASPQGIASAIDALEKLQFDRKVSIGDRDGIHKYYYVNHCGHVHAANIRVRDRQIVKIGDIDIVPGETSHTVASAKRSEDKITCILQIGNQTIRMRDFGQGLRVVQLQVKTVEADHAWGWSYDCCLYDRLTIGSRTITTSGKATVIERRINDGITFIESYGSYGAYKLTMPDGKQRIFPMNSETGGLNLIVGKGSIVATIDGESLLFTL